ncbi:META domain-containing protein [Rhodopseudomonas telluris]|uniref:META domain-containing protein n=1 Tax=Rhodopseudomonas telluris TaxID=644215 RepID=A0ABV6EVN7_9BRAD
MRSTSLLTSIALAAAFVAGSTGMLRAQPAGEFPFGLEMTLEAAPKPGSKRIPNIEIDDKGEARVELWCKGGTGQFSVAGNTVIFVPGSIDNRACPPDRAQADDALVAALSAATTWTRQGDYLTLSGGETLRFRLNTN